GIPFHASQNYIARLLKAGKKIAICEQTYIPKPGKGLATREVVEVITPGTVVDEDLLERNNNNFLAALGQAGDTLSFAYIDLSTAEFYATSFNRTECISKLKKELFRISPREMIVQESLLEGDPDLKRLLHEREDLVLNRFPDWSFDIETARTELENQLGVHNLKGFGLKNHAPEIISSGVILEYIRSTSKNLLSHLKGISIYRESSYVALDEPTQRNLELLHNLQDGSKRYTLLEVLDHCKTSMGTRRLKRWIVSPLISREAIETRYQGVDFFYRNQIALSNIRELLGDVLDLERLSSKLAMDKAHAKDLLSIKVTIRCIQGILNLISGFPEMDPFIHPHTSGSLTNETLTSGLSDLEKLHDLLDRGIREDPSIQLNEGNLIKKGYDEKLDHLAKIKGNARAVLEDLLNQEREKTNISTLKLRYNRIIGYYFEVTKSNLSLVPGHFIRRQSLSNAERYTSVKLAEIESEINNASEKIIDLERQLFLEIRNKAKGMVPLLMEFARLISEIDVLASLAFAATINGYCRPQLTEDRELKILEGRHPVVEVNLPTGSFVPNSIHLKEKRGYFILLTGPNMAGKSTFLRQIALIVLMAQIGSFVPAQEAVVGLVDKIFCRVGATDNLARGESTFLVEMNETANILRSATPKSLLLLDEVGRGTSTNDGLAIAWSISEYILSHIKAKTLFATHYHELTKLKHPGLSNLAMDVAEAQDKIVFLKKVKEGSSESSYGIHVARLAGLPEDVILRAQQILIEILDRREIDGSAYGKTEREIQTDSDRADSDRADSDRQGALFKPEEMILEELKQLDVNRTTPLQALENISKWQHELRKNEKKSQGRRTD
ncbi:MAG TPA: DNA mismatch repair protein MutS, partial [Spirochaetia bacterium]|nr:DNA mismatch repair protein MutS [Spirochaetia bacterium]